MSFSPYGFSRVTYHLKGVSKYAEEYFKLLKWKKNSKIMDIGTGSGHLLFKVEPLFPKDYAEILCVDKLEKMVEFFNVQKKDKRIRAIQLDIQTPSLPNELKGRFDFLFSCNSLMYWSDIRQAFTNVSQLLNENGQLFFIWPKRGDVHDIYKALSGRPKWAPYLSGFSKWTNYFDTKSPTETLKEEFEKVGIEVLKSELFDLPYEDEVKKNFTDMFDSLDYMSDRIPKNDLQEYKEEYRELLHSKLIMEETGDNKIKWKLPYDHLVVAARKT